MQTSARPESFTVRPGEPVRPALERFAKLVRSHLLRSVTGPGIRLHHGEMGVDLVVTEPQARFIGAFAVTLASPTAVTVGEGLVNGERPAYDGRYLDGTIAPEGTRPDPRGAPRLDLAALTREGARSYVCLSIDGEGLIQQGRVVGATLSHRERIDAEANTAWPVAELHWAGDSVTRVRQMAYFDMQVIFDGQRWIWGPA